MNIELAFKLGFIISVSWCAMWCISYLIQLIYAWVDDEKVGSLCWISKVMNFSKWKYPVFNTWGDGLNEDIKNNKVFGYAKDEKHLNSCMHGLKEGTDYKYTFGLISTYWYIGMIVSLIPVLIVIYTVTLPILLLMAILYLTRFALRVKKQFNKHIKDKTAHK